MAKIGSTNQAQIALSFPQNQRCVEQYCAWWREGFAIVRRRGAPGPLAFLCELGPPSYAITGADGQELTDRWQEALTMMERVRALWAEAASAPPETGVP